MKFARTLAQGQLSRYEYDLYGHAPVYTGAGTEELIFSLAAYRSYYVLEHGAGEPDFDGYCQTLAENGFSRLSAKASNGNRFAGYTDGENIVHVSFIRYRDVDRYVVRDVSYVAIAVDSVRSSALPDRCGAYDAVTTVQVTSIGGAFIIRLLDGRFLILDSGLGTDEVVELLYGELCRQKVGPGKPVVAAWLFSHAHGDHVGGFIALLQKYGDVVEVQRVIHGFPGEATYVGKNYMEYYMDRESEWMTRRSNRIKELMDEKMPQGKFVIAHTGQTFVYPGVTCEVVCTAENIYRQQMFDTNMSSAVFLFTLPGGRLLALGDAVDAEAKIIRRIHGKALRCDAVILAHHAYNGGDEELYANTGARAAIWPNTLEQLTERKLVGNFTNHFDPGLVQDNFIMSSGDAVMTLYDGMRAEEIARFARKLAPAGWDAVDYDARKHPQNVLTEAHLAAGFGDAPRYYGRGDDTERLALNEAEKTYTLTISGAADDNFDYYCNTLKRDGYQRMALTETAGQRSAVYASPRNAVYVDFAADGATLTITVGPAGKDALVY